MHGSKKPIGAEIHETCSSHFVSRRPTVTLKIYQLNCCIIKIYTHKVIQICSMINNFHKSVRQWSLKQVQIFCQSFQAIFGLPLNFQDISGILLNFQDVSRIVGWGWEISFPSPDFCTSSGRGTLFLTGKRKNPGWAMCKIFP